MAKEADAELARARTLGLEELTSSAEIESAEARAASAEADVALATARVAQARAEIDEQEHALGRTVVRSPISGRVGNRRAEVGMLAAPGTRLFTVGKLDSVRVSVVLTDRMLAYIEEGQRRADRHVERLSLRAAIPHLSFLNPVSHSTEAEIDVANPDGHLKPGMFVTTDVHYGESETATLVPLSALYENPATGTVGVYLTTEPLDGTPYDAEDPESNTLTDPVPFRFVPTEVIAQGRMEAAVRGVERDTWVVTLGQNLLSGDAPRARARLVAWERVERLQALQREDLMQNLNAREGR